MMNFANAGTEANENAMKVAMYNKFRQLSEKLSEKRYEKMCEQLGIRRMELHNDSVWSNYPFFIMGFKSAFHGRTATSNSMSMSKRRQKEGFQSIPYVVHVPYNENIDFDAVVDHTPIEELIDSGRLKEVIDSGKAPADLLCAFLMESIQGEGGYVIPSAGLLEKVDAFMARQRPKGTLLISDEVQTGLFRTGEFSGMQNWAKKYPNLKPDVLSFAKPLHVGGVLVQKRYLKDWPAGKFSGTWAEGNLLAIALAFYTLEELRNVNPVLGKSYGEHCKEAGEYLRGELSKLAERVESKHPGTGFIKNVRGIGQMNAFDVPDGLQGEMMYQAFLHGMHLLSTGPRSIRLFGTVDQRRREADMTVSILSDVIDKVIKEKA